MPELPCCRQAGLARGDRRGNQRRREQLGVHTGLWPVQDRQQQVDGFLVPGTREPVVPQGHPEAQRLSCRTRVARRMFCSAPKVRLVGVEPREPQALGEPVRYGAAVSATDR